MNKTNDTEFLRRYRCTVADAVFEAEFDNGFLSPANRVSHAHNHAGIEVIAVQSGISGIFTAERSYVLRESDILLIPAGIYHANDLEKQIGERMCFRLYLPNVRYDPANPLIGLLTTMTEPICCSVAEIPPILADIRREMCENPPAADDMINALLVQCFVHLLRWASKGIISSEDTSTHSRYKEPARERLKKIDFFFSRRYMHNVTLSELAEYLHISPTHTNRFLRNQYGRSFSEKLRDTRLNQARVLLEQSTLSVNRIAGEVGYASIPGFYTAFREAFGMTPMEYRIKKTEGDIQHETSI